MLTNSFPFPAAAGIGNGIFIFIAFVCTLPALATNSRSWLKFAVFLIVVNSLFTLIIGLDLWIFTLRIKDTFATLWMAQPAEVQGLMQTAVSESPSYICSEGKSLTFLSPTVPMLRILE
jgi:hypothetical protein